MDEADNSFLRVINGNFDSNSHAAIDDAVRKLMIASDLMCMLDKALETIQ